MGCPAINQLTVSGGAAQNPILNQLKAELFNVPVLVLKENDTSALGAAKMAAKGLGMDTTFNQAVSTVVPQGNYREILLKRHQVYKAIYPKLKEEFLHFHQTERI